MTWETREVVLKVKLPRDMADEVANIEARDPEYFSRVVLYAMTRRSINRYIQERSEVEAT